MGKQTDEAVGQDAQNLIHYSVSVSHDQLINFDVWLIFVLHKCCNLVPSLVHKFG